MPTTVPPNTPTTATGLDTTTPTDEVDIDVLVVARALTPPEPDTAAPAEDAAWTPPTGVPHPISQSDEALGTVTRGALRGMLLGMAVFLVISAILRATVAGLAGLDAASTITYLLLSAGLGMIPGIIYGLSRAEERLLDADHR